jgi:nucleotide-binding universal stress UspA family protein
VPFQKVLVAYDFSEPSRRALEFACKVVRAGGGHLDLVHIHPELYLGDGPTALEFPWPKPEQEERYLRFLKQELHTAIPPDLEGRAKPIVVVGDPRQTLLDRARELGSDVIVVGATGKGRVDRALLGSVSRSLVHQSSVPVVTVP